MEPKRASVADRAAVRRVFDEHAIEAVIHAAALHKPDIVRYPSEAFVDANVTGTLTLINVDDVGDDLRSGARRSGRRRALDR